MRAHWKVAFTVCAVVVGGAVAIQFAALDRQADAKTRHVELKRTDAPASEPAAAARGGHVADTMASVRPPVSPNATPAVPAEARDSENRSIPARRDEDRFASGVSSEDLESYFQRSPANFVADRAMLAYLDAQPLLNEIENTREVHCHGWLCRLVFELGTPGDATRLASLPHPDGVDVSYSARVIDLKRTTATVFVALPGAKLAALVASHKQRDADFPQEAAIARAVEVEARWRAGRFGAE